MWTNYINEKSVAKKSFFGLISSHKDSPNFCHFIKHPGTVLYRIHRVRQGSADHNILKIIESSLAEAIETEKIIFIRRSCVLWIGLCQWIIRRKRKRIKRQIDHLQEESPFRTTEYGTSRQQVAKERTKMTFDQNHNTASGPIKSSWFHFWKRWNSKKSLQGISLHKNALFNWQRRKVFFVPKVLLVVFHVNWTIKIWYKTKLLGPFISWLNENL